MPTVSTADAWLKPLVDWPSALSHVLLRTPVVVRIVLATVRGSAPREPGVAMLLSSEGIEGTIGGGQLEWQALGVARAMLVDATEPARLQRLVLGADLGQCCGGVVEVWIERYTRAERGLLDAAMIAAHQGPAVLESTIVGTGVSRRLVCAEGLGVDADQLLRAPRALAPPRVRCGTDATVLRERLDVALPTLWLYGAGHVGQALTRILSELPLRLTWVDSRADVLPAAVGDSVQTVHTEDPAATVSDAPPDAHFLVLTHSHALDYSLCRTILLRDDFAWLGLIGSSSKAARFRSRLTRDGLGPAAIERMVCPIGIPGIRSKWPAAIAVAVVAQLLLDSGARADTRIEMTETPHGPGAASEVCSGIACASCGMSSEGSGGAGNEPRHLNPACAAPS
jgi:xanthine dehydrogenase accessory factor